GVERAQIDLAANGRIERHHAVGRRERERALANAAAALGPLARGQNLPPRDHLAAQLLFVGLTRRSQLSVPSAASFEEEVRSSCLEGTRVLRTLYSQRGFARRVQDHLDLYLSHRRRQWFEEASSQGRMLRKRFPRLAVLGWDAEPLGGLDRSGCRVVASGS